MNSGNDGESGLKLSAKEKLEYKFHDLSTRTSAIRSLIISEFDVFENIQYSSFKRTDLFEIIDPKKRIKVLNEDPFQPCGFSTLQRFLKEDSTNVAEKRLARKRARGIIPFGVFADFLSNRKNY